MKIFRKLLVQIIGVEKYLRLISRIYVGLVLRGFLKKSYKELFFLKELVKPGFYCLDIGANLGYYSTMLSKIVGETGKVIAVEPIPMFCKILKKNVKMSHRDNVEIYNFALGDKNEVVKMGTPERGGVFRHGLTKLVESSDDNYARFYEVEMKKPDELFGNLNRLDFVKCDVEGYEHFVFENMTAVIEKFKPVIQVELNGDENRQKVISVLGGLGYKPHYLNQNKQLVLADNKIIDNPKSDFYFLYIN